MIDIEEIQKKLYHSLFESGWSFYLRTFFLSDEMKDIISKLQLEVENNRDFVPQAKDWFNFLKYCPFNKVKVVFVNYGPYTRLVKKNNKFLPIADGLAFSTQQNIKIPNGVRELLYEINKTVYNFKSDFKYDTNLIRWAKQGVLLFNTSITGEINTFHYHNEIWHNFTKTIFEILNYEKENIIYVFFGKKVLNWVNYITNESHYIFEVKHPNIKLTMNLEWDCENIFNKINSIIEEHYGSDEKIIW